MQRLIAWSVGAALVALVGVLGVYRLQRGVMLDPATFSMIHSGTGWHNVETLPPDGMHFRWTNGSATLELPNPGVGLRRW